MDKKTSQFIKKLLKDKNLRSVDFEAIAEGSDPQHFQCTLWSWDKKRESIGGWDLSPVHALASALADLEEQS